MRFRFSATSLSERNEELRWRNKEVTIKCLQLLKAVIYNEIVRLPGDWKDNVSLYSGSVHRLHCSYCFIVSPLWFIEDQLYELGLTAEFICSVLVSFSPGPICLCSLILSIFPTFCVVVVLWLLSSTGLAVQQSL